MDTDLIIDKLKKFRILNKIIKYSMRQNKQHRNRNCVLCDFLKVVQFVFPTGINISNILLKDASLTTYITVQSCPPAAG